MKKESKLPTARETLKIIDKAWCTVKDICTPTGLGKNNAFKIKNEINNKISNQGFKILDKYVPTDKLIEYLNLNIEYLKKVSDIISENI